MKGVTVLGLASVLGLLLGVTASSASDPVVVTVKCTGLAVETCVVDGDVEGAHASATASYRVNMTSGFNDLQITTGQEGEWENGFVHKVKSYAAGIAEAIVTCDDMAAFKYNVLTSSFGYIDADLNADLKSFILTQDEWVRSRSAQYTNGSAGLGSEADYW